MTIITSPQEYRDSALFLMYNHNDMCVLESSGGIWDGRIADVAELEAMPLDGTIRYLEAQGLLLIYMNPDCKPLAITTDGNTLYFFAEVTPEGNISARSTSADETYLPKGKMLLKKGKTVTSIEALLEPEATPPPGYNTVHNPVPSAGNQQGLQEENSRLKTLISELYDKAYNDVYTQTGVADIDGNMQKLYAMKLEHEKKLRSYGKLHDELQELNEQTEELVTKREEILKQINVADELKERGKAELAEKEGFLKAKLEELGIDRSTLNQYSGEQGINELSDRVAALEEEVRAALNGLIVLRQKICNGKHDKIAGG